MDRAAPTDPGTRESGVDLRQTPKPDRWVLGPLAERPLQFVVRPPAPVGVDVMRPPGLPVFEVDDVDRGYLIAYDFDDIGDMVVLRVRADGSDRVRSPILARIGPDHTGVHRIEPLGIARELWVTVGRSRWWDSSRVPGRTVTLPGNEIRPRTVDGTGESPNRPFRPHVRRTVRAGTAPGPVSLPAPPESVSSCSTRADRPSRPQ